MSGNTQEDGFEFVRQMWGKMGFGLPGMVTPTLDTDELERRIKDLQAVEGWLKMNLNMLQLHIHGLEMQRAALAAMQNIGQGGAENPSAGTENNPFANGETSRSFTATAPADCPAIVVRAGSPPKSAMCALTHVSASIMSSSP